MAFKNSPLNDSSIDLEREAIKRLRGLAPFMGDKCRVSRELNGSDTVLCLDFSDCPQDLKMSEKEWSERAVLLAFSCEEVGLAKAVVWKKGEQIVAGMIVEQIA